MHKLKFSYHYPRQTRALVQTIFGELVGEYHNRRRRLRAIEIGVERGETAEALLRVFPRLRIALIDPWQVSRASPHDGDNHQANMLQTMDRLKVWRENGQAKIIASHSCDAVKHAPKRCDWIFIDGDHRYKGVKNDLNLYWPKLRPGGLMVGDDYNSSMEQARGTWGVKKAVDEFVEKMGLELHRVAMWPKVYWVRKPIPAVRGIEEGNV